MDLLDPLFPLHQYHHEDLEILSDQLLPYYQLYRWIQTNLEDHHIQAGLEVPEALYFQQLHGLPEDLLILVVQLLQFLQFVPCLLWFLEAQIVRPVQCLPEVL